MQAALSGAIEEAEQSRARRRPAAEGRRKSQRTAEEPDCAEAIDPSKDLRLLRTAKEVADELRVITAARIEELAAAGYMPHIVIEGRRWYWRRQVYDYAREHMGTVVSGRPMDQEVGQPPGPDEVPPDLRSEMHALRRAEGDGYPPCVYFLIREQAVIYVGQSRNFSSRIQQHREKSFDYALFLPVPVEDLLRVEGEFIRRLRPPLNRKDGGLWDESPLLQ